jgi:cobalt-zinc-cadmium efflux system outer membrane protein
MTVLLNALVLGVLAQSPAAANGLTLDRAIAEALRSEPGLASARAERDAVRADRQQAAARPNPDVAFEQREQTGGPDRQTSIGIELPLDAFRRGPRLDAAAASVDRTEAALGDRERLLVAEVRARYGEALEAARRVEVMDAVTDAARRTYELLANRAAEGASPPLERDLALVELRRLEGQRALASGRASMALTALKVSLGRAPSSPLTLADALEDLVTRAADAAADTAIDTRADVREAAAGVEVARAGTRLAEQDRKPDLSLFGGYMRMDQGFPQFGLSPSGTPEPIHGVFHNVSAGVKLSLPIFNRGQGSIAAAKAREEAAAQMLASRRLAAAGEIELARARLAAARRALSAYEGDTRAVARRNVDVVRETYSLGRATLFEVLTEQRRYLDFEAAYIGALAETFAALTDLQRAKGASR